MTTRSDCLDCPSPAFASHNVAGPRGLGRVLTNLLTRFSEWQERAEQRHHLAGMDERMLKDIGVTQVDAVREATKPFWRP